MRAITAIIAVVLMALIVDFEIAASLPCVPNGTGAQAAASTQSNNQPGDDGFFRKWVSCSGANWPIRRISNVDWTAEAVTAAATAILALLTFVLAFGTVFLWLVTKRLVRGAEDTAERQLRAYVSASVRDLYDFNQPGRDMGFTVEFRNHGQTPAYDLHYRVAIAAENYPLRDKYPWPQLAEINTSRTISYPDKPSAGNFTASQFDPATINALLTVPNHRLYVFGRVEYVDIFKKTQWTKFCVSLINDANMRALAAGTNGVPLLWDHSAQHNEAS